ncbi:coiled-coil domain-containing protein 180-like isoform X1 [Lytechinus variegatus]|uniref:coiled-coil domain-containing protein 180-like isoform X1 n=1 Tax=Lytechinus variegatus TaxID=7654 RepID=UPI001BB27E1E|nr:coiled-coil domain-containing protein 180-like isoform X1 [Lytechinus variegatus]XP_041481344.1 coiled-coil domain-containing protein 180-like isoform X1 [Lytechinus variegatus]
MMAETKAVRVVPSGHIYKQIFDAQVQLVKTLEQNDHPRQQCEPKTLSVPLVHENRAEMGKSLLPSRDVDWMESLPNNQQTENPVLYKQSVENADRKAKEPKSVIAAREVRGLADTIESEKLGSDIIERLAESRRVRHDEATEDLHHEFTIISNDIEPKIAASGELLIKKLDDNDKEIEKMLARIADDDELKDYSLSELVSLWAQIEEQAWIRREFINEMDATLTSLEDDRLAKLKDILKTYAKKMEGIAYLMPPDVQRLIEKESTVINQTLLINRRAYTDLHARLMKTDIERDKNHRGIWEDRLADWRKLNIEIAVNKFLDFMQSDRIVNPSKVNVLLEKLHHEQVQLNVERLEILAKLNEMKPPRSTKTAAYQWNKEIVNSCQRIEQVHVTYLDELHTEYEQVCKECLDMVESFQSELLDAGVCTEEKVVEVTEERILPEVGRRQVSFEKALEEMDLSLERLAERHAQELRSLFKFTQGAAHLWDVHEINLAKKERQLQEQLEECRRKHDNLNQDMEANLDILMDRLRQESSEEALKTTMDKAHQMLLKIQDSYLNFYEDQEMIVQGYPSMVQEELQRYDDTLCIFFGVDRINPLEKQAESKKLQEEQASSIKSQSDSPKSSRAGSRAESRTSSQGVRETSSPAGSRADSQAGSQAGSEAGSQPDTSQSTKLSSNKFGTSIRDSSLRKTVLTSDPKMRGSSSRSRDSPSSSPAPSQEPPIVTEVLLTSNGTNFYVLTVAGEHGITSDGDQNEGQAVSEEGRPVYLVNVTIPQETLNNLRKTMRMSFLEHLEEWKVYAVERAHSVVAAKTEELKSELDLRLHLHEPRSQRTELDIHNVRAAELLLHQERVSKHSKGVSCALSEVKQRFATMQKEHDGVVEKFKQEIDTMENVFVNASRSADLVSLSHQVNTKVESHMDVIRASLRQFRTYLDDTLQMLRESNARFIKSFKLFSDGGNFSPEEVEAYKKKLEKLATKIDSAEGFVMADLEGMEARRLAQATTIAGKFEDRFKSHLFDLTFIEKLSRWLNNTQVKIKGEVAQSNTQAQSLMRLLNKLETRVDACERPNLDKEQITPGELLETLPSIFQAFDERAQYLNCAKHLLLNAPPANLAPSSRGNQNTTPKVVFTSEQQQQQGVGSQQTSGTAIAQTPMTSTTTAALKAAKLQSEDAAVSVIKNILTSQKHKMKGQEEETPLTTPSVSRPLASQPVSTAGDGQGKGVARPPAKLVDKERSKVNHVKRTTSMTSEHNPRRSASGIQKNKNNGLKFDPKYYVFGEKPEKETHFLALIKKTLQDALDGLLTTADLYYRQKGSRPVTRPQAIHEIFEQCADVIVTKLQSYYKQADEYHNQCLQEFREQLERLEIEVAKVPSLVIKQLLKHHIQKANGLMKQGGGQFTQKLSQWEKARTQHKILLRPTLGHPHNHNELVSLCDQEEERRKEFMAGVDENAKNLRDAMKSCGDDFVKQLATTTEQLLILLDSELTVDDVITGRVDPKRMKTSALMRRKQAGLPLEDNEYIPLIKRGTRQWEGLPLSIQPEPTPPPKIETQTPSQTPSQTRSRSRLAKGKKVEAEVAPKPTTTAAVTTQKTTLAHQATYDARNQAFKQSTADYEQRLKEIATKQEEQTIAENRWTGSWQTAVQKVKDLY